MSLIQSQGSQARFFMKYEGPAFAESAMDVRELGPALVSLGEIIDEVNGFTNGDGASVAVNVTATTRGSFLVDFDISQAHQAIGGFIATAPQIVEIVFGESGVVALLKWLKGQTPRLQKGKGSQKPIENSGGETRLVQNNVIAPLFSRNIIVNINNVVRPIEKEGENSVRFYTREQSLEEVSKADLGSFVVPESQETLIDSIHKRALTIDGPVFEEGNKWYFGDGETTIRATMKDKKFQERIDKKLVSFTKGDMLICELRTIQKKVNEKLRTEFEVVSVIEYEPVRRQLPFSEVET